MSRLIPILGWCVCLFLTAGLLKPSLLQGPHYPLSECEDGRWVDRCVSLVIVGAIWAVWVAGVRLRRDGYEQCPGWVESEPFTRQERILMVGLLALITVPLLLAAFVACLPWEISEPACRWLNEHWYAPSVSELWAK